MEVVVFEHFLPLSFSGNGDAAHLAAAAVDLWALCGPAGRDGLRRLLQQLHLYGGPPLSPCRRSRAVLPTNVLKRHVQTTRHPALQAAGRDQGPL